MMLKTTISASLFCLLCTALYAADYYWVGGSGNWSDISHWATTSGGSTFHDQAPTSNDNVFFDGKSFSGGGQTVTVNTDIIFCRNMDWTGAVGNPIFTAADNRTLNIYGSLVLNVNMDFDFAGSIRMLALDPGHIVQANGNTVGRMLTFEGDGGEWTLESPLDVDSVLRVRSGTLLSADHSISSKYLDVRKAGLAATLDLGSSKVTLGGDSGGGQNSPSASFVLKPDSLTFLAADAGFEFTSGSGGIVIEGNGTVTIGSLVFSGAGGTANIDVESTLHTDRLQFANSADISGVVNPKVLILAAGKAYTFESNLTYTIGRLDGPGQCEAPIQLFASVSGVPAIFSSATGPIQVKYASIKDINANGGATFTADNSSDLGNNDGWSINSSNQNDLYWVGGSGNWNDSNHWSFTSGGSGGACVPKGGDNVFFDAQSFSGPADTVYINVENALCQNMDWTGATGTPVFDGVQGRNLRIYGSLAFIGDMTLDFDGNVYFESTAAGNTITTGGHLFNRSVLFDGNGGAWSLNDTLQVSLNVSLISGFLTTNNQTVICEQFLSQSLFDRQLLLGESHIVLRQLNQAGGVRTCNFWIHSQNLVFDAGTSLIDFAQFGQLRTDGSGTVNYYEVNFNWQGSTRNESGANVYVHSMTFNNDGTLQNGLTIGTLFLAASYEYTLASYETFTINNFIASGDCKTLIYIHTSSEDQAAYIKSPGNINGDYLVLRDIHNVSGNVFTAINSIDAGNNKSWQIDQLTPRTLYWVGGSGDWYDTAHWSLSSGGPGGECIPTPVDDVFFDENSFDQPGQLVDDIYPKHYCHDLIWKNISGTPRFALIELLVFGSLEFVDDMEVEVFNTRFTGDEPGHTINTRGHHLEYTSFRGAGDWMLQDTFNGYSLGMEHGGWNTNSYPVNLDYFFAYSDHVPKTLVLGNTHMTLRAKAPTYPWSVSGDFNLQSDSSLIEMTSPKATFYNRLKGGGELVYNQVLFSAKDGSSVVNSGAATSIRANHLQFNNDGTVWGANTFDTLIFAPGKSYRLEAQQTQTITEHWQIIGNNCVPIQLTSTERGVKSTAFMASGRVNGDFIQMRDQIATGGAEFFAGIHSTNVGDSNTGWIFDNADDYVETGFLGKDLILCNTTPIVLNADNKGPDETYLWQDGSAEQTFTVPGPGTYWAEVSFTSDCVLRDSVQIIPEDAFAPDLGNDTTLCTGSNILLDATFEALGVSYLWQDGSTNPTLTAEEPGEYKVELELSGCTVRDSLELTYFDPPPLEVAPDQTLCFGTILDLDARIADAVAYNWQDGTTGADYSVATPGTYWVDIDFAHCIRRDSVVIDYHPEVVVELGSDTTLCEGQTLLIDAAQPDASYAWQDGSSGSAFTVSQPAVYWVDVTISGCTVRDSLQAFYNPLPVFDLGPDLRPCEEENPRLQTNIPGAVYNWQDGSSQADFVVNNDGLYWLDVTVDGCTERDSVRVDYIVLPESVLGEDRILCDGEQVDFDVAVPGGSYVWQDGQISPNYQITSSGDYSVAISVEQCSVTDEVSIIFNPTPTFSLRNDTLLCQGQTLNLGINTFADEYRWSDGSADSDLTVSYPGGVIWAETRLDNCTFRDEIVVDYQEPPSLDIGQDTLICEDFDLMLTAGVAAESYLWQDGSTASSLRTSGAGVYTLEVTDGPCLVSDSVFVGTRPCIYFDVYVPNAFSPNGDGINDILRPMLSSEIQITDYNFKVYDRWGTEVFSTTSLEEAWDGSLRSLPLPMGIYVYFVQFEYTDDRGSSSDLITGDIMLMR